MNYVLGFLFHGKGSDMEVALIRKLKPVQQVGKLNGIGGKIEAGEPPFDAMCREFFEETDALVTSWTHMGQMTTPWGVVHVFAHWADSQIELRSQTEEQVGWYNMAQLATRDDLMPSLHEILTAVSLGRAVDIKSDY
jgi:8-oxo-dGTP diphosphatase